MFFLPFLPLFLFNKHRFFYPEPLQTKPLILIPYQAFFFVSLSNKDFLVNVIFFRQAFVRNSTDNRTLMNFNYTKSSKDFLYSLILAFLYHDR